MGRARRQPRLPEVPGRGEAGRRSQAGRVLSDAGVQPGRTAPWAKVFGAFVLALITAIVAAYGIGAYREAERERSAFEATREDARRFADTLSRSVTGRAIDRRDAQQALNKAVAKEHGLLLSVTPTRDGTRVIVQLSRFYRRSLPLFGPADTVTRRCFAIDFDSSAQHTRITSQTTCSRATHGRQ
ncbi:hypothetical protein GCM10010255_77570 [Streptomyces coeruleofuscus]|uniref:Uncharacterized protein n=1 Tax=Streptomyces coeruleofuscus TaxID=66879 RepID=A0ABP5WCA0_9ACTN